MKDGDRPAGQTDKQRLSLNYRSGILAAIIISVTIGLAFAVLILSRTPNQMSASFRQVQQTVDFPLYYPSSLPSYYFIESGSIQANNDVVIFPISRNDGQKMTVTEQKLPDGFDLSKITGTRDHVTGLGEVVVGTGFQGYRAVITTSKTLIFVSSSDQITISDFGTIVKSFVPLD